MIRLVSKSLISKLAFKNVVCLYLYQVKVTYLPTVSHHADPILLPCPQDVLIIASDVPLPNNPEAVPRRPAQLTEEERQKLKSQGFSPDCQDEVAIVKASYDLEKIFGVEKSEPKKLLSRELVRRRCTTILNDSKSNEGKGS